MWPPDPEKAGSCYSMGAKTAGQVDPWSEADAELRAIQPEESAFAGPAPAFFAQQPP